jgi:WD40 repeat protein
VVEEIPAMKRRSSRSQCQDDIRGTHQQHGESVSAGRVPFLPLGSILRSVALIIVVVFLLCWSDEKPASRRNSLLGTHPGKVTTVAYAPDGRWIASAGYYSPVVIWDISLRQIDTILENSPATTLSLAFSPNGASLAAAEWMAP